MTLGYYAPRPPARSGVTEHAARLHKVLAAEYSIADERDGDINVYHLGNNQLHAEIYRRALKRPGIVVVHDAVLHHFALGFFSRDEYLHEFIYNYGDWSRSLAEDLWAERARSAADERYFRYGMLRRIAERSRAVVVHNPAAARIVREHCPDARVTVVPLLFTPEETPHAEKVLQVRATAGAGPLDLLCGIFGHLRESKRIQSAVSACERAGVRLLIAGDCPNDLRRSLQHVFEHPGVARVPYASERTYSVFRHAVDVCINLRYPAAGETSAVGVEMMGIGKPVLATRSDEISDYPEGTCVPIEPGVAERDHLTTVLRWLAAFRGHARRIGARAADHIGREHTADRVRAAYRTAIGSALMLLLLASVTLGEQRFVAKIPTRDGARLATNVFLPRAEGRYPALLIRTPYGKGTELLPNYRVFLDVGYAIVVQDVRGRYDSTGQFRFTHETSDADETLNWIGKQTWSDGRVSMLGGSYVGITQWRAAMSGNPHLVSIFPVVAGSDEYRDRFYSRGGAIKLAHRLLWIRDNMKAPAYVPPSMESIVGTVPLRVADRTATGRTVDFWQETLNHPSYDHYWRTRSTYERLGSVRVPAFIVGGWYDNYVEGDLEAFTALSRQSAAHRIVIGPWGHNMTLPFASGIAFGKSSAAPVRRFQLDWFRYFMLEQQPALPFPYPPVQIFVMGTNKWREENEWPLARARQTPFYLTSLEGANSVRGDGSLVPQPGRDDQDVFTYDPRRPVPTAGGAVCCNPKEFPYGPMDQRAVEMRSDVLVYSTPPLKRDTEVTGPIRVVLHVSTTAPDTDFTAKLVDVFPDGHARNLCDGILRLRYRDGLTTPKIGRPGQVYAITIEAGVTSNVFLAGHRIRLEISSSNFPRFDRNPNTGRPIADERELRVARQTVYHGKARPSHVILPVIP